MAPKKRTSMIEISDNATEISTVEPVKTTIEKKPRKNTKQKKTGQRAPSSYVLFSMEYRKEVAQTHPDLTLGEVSKKCGEKWGTLSEEEKLEWKTKSDTLKSERCPKNDNEEPKKKRKPSSYLCFSMNFRKQVVEAEPTLSLGEVSKRCGEEWKKLSVEEKEVWKAKANES